MKMISLIVLFFAGGILYVTVELLWRGRSHGSMFLDGGVCFLLIGALNELAPAAPLTVQAFLGACVITASELAFGAFVNRSYAVWDYRALRPNFRGQICLCYFTLWIPLSLFAIFADDALRRVLFGAPWHGYVFF